MFNIKNVILKSLNKSALFAISSIILGLVILVFAFKVIKANGQTPQTPPAGTPEGQIEGAADTPTPTDTPVDTLVNTPAGTPIDWSIPTATPTPIQTPSPTPAFTPTPTPTPETYKAIIASLNPSGNLPADGSSSFTITINVTNQSGTSKGGVTVGLTTTDSNVMFTPINASDSNNPTTDENGNASFSATSSVAGSFPITVLVYHTSVPTTGSQTSITFSPVTSQTQTATPTPSP